MIATMAGNGTLSSHCLDFTGDSGPATGAQMCWPYGIAADGAGNLFIEDSNRVRKVSLDGMIAAVAGNGTPGYSGDSGLATDAQLSLLYGIAVDGVGNLFIADYSNARIRKVSTDGIITTVAGNGTRGYSGDGGPATAAQLGPSGVAVDGAGNLFIAEIDNNSIRKVSPDGIITTAANAPQPYGVAVDGAGNLFISDTNHSRVLKVSPDGSVTSVAGNGTPGYSGDGGLATAAQLNFPWGLAVDGAGNVYVADTANNVVRILRPVNNPF
jgi:NHL repeat-containing protein